MLPPISVELVVHDENWARQALAEARVLSDAIGSCLKVIEHVGSTAIPGIRAKPILDLMPLVSSLATLEDRRSAIEAAGYRWHGEYGLSGRRYCTKSDPLSGRRVVQAHCYEFGHFEARRHIAFRDYLRARPDVARAYETEKLRCQKLHPNDSHAYTDCKSEWIKIAEGKALEWYAERGST